jgi:nucleosome binding factor SPN SPT16 subunit
MKIDAIPSKKLDTIKEWLTSVKIKYYESKLNLAWKPILKHIMSDPQGFIDDVRGGRGCGCVCVSARHGVAA